MAVLEFITANLGVAMLLFGSTIVLLIFLTRISVLPIFLVAVLINLVLIFI